MPVRTLFKLYSYIRNEIVARTGVSSLHWLSGSSASDRWNLGPSTNPVTGGLETYWVRLDYHRSGMPTQPIAIEGWIGFRYEEGQCASITPITEEMEPALTLTDIERIIQPMVDTINHAVETGCVLDLTLFSPELQPR